MALCHALALKVSLYNSDRWFFYSQKYVFIKILKLLQVPSLKKHVHYSRHTGCQIPSRLSHDLSIGHTDVIQGAMSYLECPRAYLQALQTFYRVTDPTQTVPEPIQKTYRRSTGCQALSRLSQIPSKGPIRDVIQSDSRQILSRLSQSLSRRHINVLQGARPYLA